LFSNPLILWLLRNNYVIILNKILFKLTFELKWLLMVLFIIRVLKTTACNANNIFLKKYIQVFTLLVLGWMKMQKMMVLCDATTFTLKGKHSKMNCCLPILFNAPIYSFNGILYYSEPLDCFAQYINML